MSFPFVNFAISFTYLRTYCRIVDRRHPNRLEEHHKNFHGNMREPIPEETNTALLVWWKAHVPYVKTRPRHYFTNLANQPSSEQQPAVIPPWELGNIPPGYAVQDLDAICWEDAYAVARPYETEDEPWDPLGDLQSVPFGNLNVGAMGEDQQAGPSGSAYS